MNKNVIPTEQEIFNEYKNATNLDQLNKIKRRLGKQLHSDELGVQSNEQSTELLKYSNNLFDEFKVRIKGRDDLRETEEDDFFITGKPKIFYDKYGQQWRIASGKYWCKRNALAVDKIIIPKEVNIIGQNAFRDVIWPKLEFEERGNNPIVIGAGAFSQYLSFYGSLPQEIINMPHNIQFIGSGPYKPLYMPFENCCIGCFQLFSGQTTIMSYIYPQVTWVALNDTTTIKAFMFAECDKLNKISEAENVNEIQKGAFTHCESLEELALLNAKFIGDYAFQDCKNLKRLDLPNVTSVGKHVFAGCSPELKIYTKADKLPLFANAFTDSFENHKDQFIV